MWRCSLCETENPMDREFCSGCDAPLASTLRPPGPQRPQRDPNMTALVSLFMPGAGHAYLGMWGQALARGFISVWVVFTALIGAVQGSMMLGVVFGIAALCLWAVAAHDAYREASNIPDAVLLKGKTFLYVVLGLLVLLMVMLFIGAMQAQSV